MYACILSRFSPVGLCNAMGCSSIGPSGHGDPSGKNTGVGCYALIQGLFLTQESSPRLLCLLHWSEGSLPLMPSEKFVSHVRDLSHFYFQSFSSSSSSTSSFSSSILYSHLKKFKNVKTKLSSKPLLQFAQCTIVCRSLSKIKRVVNEYTYICLWCVYVCIHVCMHVGNECLDRGLGGCLFWIDRSEKWLPLEQYIEYNEWHNGAMERPETSF